MESQDLDWSPVIDWFGYLPAFHDAEVVAIDLRRSPLPSRICIHAFRMTSDVEERGYFRLDKHALVTFTFAGIRGQDFTDWNHQNALLGLTVSAVEDGHRLELESAYGVGGHVVASAISISVEPVAAEDVATTLVAMRHDR